MSETLSGNTSGAYPALYPAQSPGIYSLELDASPLTNGVSTTIGAIAAASRRGPLGPKLVTGGTSFVAAYGPPDITWSNGHTAALAFLTQSKQLWFNRAVSQDATYACAQVFNDVAGVNANATYFMPCSSGSPNPVGNAQPSFNLVLNHPLQAGDTVSVTVADSNGLQAIGLATFAVNNDTTLQALAANLAAEINDVWNAPADIPNAFIINPATATALIPATSQGSAARAIHVVTPLLELVTNGITTYPEIQLTLEFSSVTTNSTVVSFHETNLLDIWAQNPGAWANNYGFAVTNISYGVQQQTTLTFSSALINLNSVEISLNINGNAVQIPAVTFAANNDTTLSNLATEITNALEALGGQGSAFVNHINGANYNDRQIVIISPFDGPNTMTVPTAQVVNGNTQATIGVAQTVTGIAGQDTFTLGVFTRSNLTTPVQSFNVSFNQQQDGFGNQQFIEQVINVANGGSLNIAVYYSGAALNPSGRILNVSPQICWLTGGNDGSLPEDGSNEDLPGSNTICAAWNWFYDSETYAVDLLINAGYTTPTVQQNMSSIATTRRDCMSILDMPSGSQEVSSALAYCANQLNVTDSYSAIYTPDLQVVDSTTDQLFWSPPSGNVAATFANVDENYGVWFANAGIIRGVLPNVQNLRYIYKQADRDQLDPAQINVIRKIRGSFAIYGVNTRYPVASLLQFTSVRRLYLFMEKTIIYSLVANDFDPINPNTEFLITQKINGFLQPLENQEAISNFLVLCSSINNGPNNIDAGQLNVTVYVVPNPPAKVIVLRSVVTPSSISFQELIASSVF